MFEQEEVVPVSLLVAPRRARGDRDADVAERVRLRRLHDARHLGQHGRLVDPRLSGVNVITTQAPFS